MHNFHLDPKGRIWVAWNPRYYQLQLLHMSVQFIHYRALQISTNLKFYITFVCGLNHLQQRQGLWDELSTYQPSDEPWCVIGDFNVILYKEDRMGGDEVRIAELLDLKSFMDTCELQEMRSIGPYYSWTNKSVWSRIDRAITNVYWCGHFNFTQVRYEA